jgi:acetolactate synthase-1/2/3 large subunit
MWAAQFLFFNERNTFISSGGLGAMGFELPAAMGAQIAKPDVDVWAIAGDGGFQMTLQELATVAQEKMPIKIALFNNGHLGMVKQWQELFFENHLKEVPIPGPEFVKLAQAYGIPARRVTHQEDVTPALREAQEYDGPYLVEFVVNPAAHVYPMVPPGGSLADTLEDPLLASPT